MIMLYSPCRTIEMISLLLLMFIASSESSIHWAVQVDGGMEVAEQIAKENGFNFLGKVGELNDIYHFSTNSDFTRFVRRQVNYLRRNKQVGLFLRQKVKFHEKREFTVPNDPLWNFQWQLYRNEDGRDNNVQRAWLQGLSGEGITVGVVDDGLEYRHPDLLRNHASKLSFDFINRDSDPRPRYSPFQPASTHGTRCAGIISMVKDNNKCGVGIAYNSKIAGLRLLTNHGTTDIQEATALNYKYDEIDIYSNSWGPSDTGFSAGGPDLLTKMALENGVKKGRQGKGSIFVWAAGNGGARGDSCAADGYVNSIYTIAVGSVDESGNAAYFDEQCSAKLVVTFNHDSTNGIHMSTTTGRTSCMSSFTGTSAASPIVSGVIALALQANPNLTWRDIQYLLVYTANSNVLMTESTTDLWHTNGAGLRVSPQFGFGAINAEAMVTRARYWTTVPEQLVTIVNPTNISGEATNVSPYSVSWEMDSLLGKGDVRPHYTNITYLEHVVVKMTLMLTFGNIPSFSYDVYYSDDYEIGGILSHKFARRGDISVSLRSPQGTISELLPKRERDFINTNGYRNWEFMSVHYWGENPLGAWELLVSYKSKVGTVRVSDISVQFYGSKATPLSVVQLSKCTDKCDYKCSFKNNMEICDMCLNKRDSETLNCLTECPANYDETSSYCMNPNSSRSVESSNSFLLPTTTDHDIMNNASPTPSSHHSYSKPLIIIASSAARHESVIINLSSTAIVSNSNLVKFTTDDKEFKNSASTTNPHLLQWLILLPLLWSIISI